MFTLILEANEYYAEFNYSADSQTHIEYLDFIQNIGCQKAALKYNLIQLNIWVGLTNNLDKSL